MSVAKPRHLLHNVRMLTNVAFQTVMIVIQVKIIAVLVCVRARDDMKDGNYTGKCQY